MLLALFIAAQAPILTVTLADGKVITVDDAAWSALKQETVKDKAGTFVGVNMHVLFEAMEVPLGEKGKVDLAVVVDCKDGYRVVFGLGEIDPLTSGRTILIARQKDRAPIADGPQLVVPGDKRQARWARQVTSMKIVAVK